MKKYTYILFNLFVATLIACNPQPINNDLTKENIKGNPKLIKEDYTYTFYNKDGFKTKSFRYKDESASYETVEYTYDKNNNLQKIQEYNVFPYITNQFTSITTTFFYGDKSNLNLPEKSVKEGYALIDGKRTDLDTEIFNYFYEGNKLVKKIMNPYTDMINAYNENEITYTYSDSGYIQEEKFHLKNSKGNFYYTDITYYINNIPVKHISTADDDTSPDIYIYEYEFDNKGNWTKSTKKDENTKSENTVTERKYFFEGDDISIYEKKFVEVSNKFAEYLKYTGKNSNSKSQPATTDENHVFEGNSSTSSSKDIVCFKCNGTGECRTCSKSFSVHYWDGNGWKDRSESRPGYLMCSTCRGAGVFYKRSDFGKYEIEKECYVGSCNDGWIYCQECNYGGNGRNIGQCNDCKGSGSRN